MSPCVATGGLAGCDMPVPEPEPELESAGGFTEVPGLDPAVVPVVGVGATPMASATE